MPSVERFPLAIGHVFVKPESAGPVFFRDIGFKPVLREPCALFRLEAGRIQTCGLPLADPEQVRLDNRILGTPGAFRSRRESRGAQGNLAIVDLTFEISGGQASRLHVAKRFFQFVPIRREPEELLEVRVAKTALPPGLEDKVRQGQDRDPGPNIGRPDPGLLSQPLDGVFAVAGRVGFKGLGLLELREVLPLQILDQHEVIGLVVGQFPDDRRDRFELDVAGGPKAPLAGDYLEWRLFPGDGPDDDRLDNALLADGFDELVEFPAFKTFPRIHSGRTDLADRDFPIRRISVLTDFCHGRCSPFNSIGLINEKPSWPRPRIGQMQEGQEKAFPGRSR